MDSPSRGRLYRSKVRDLITLTHAVAVRLRARARAASVLQWGAGERRPGPHIAMLEDSAKNLATAKALGLTTLLVGGATAAEERGAAGASAAGQQSGQGCGGGPASGAGAAEARGAGGGVKASGSGAGVRLAAGGGGGAGAAASSAKPGHALGNSAEFPSSASAHRPEYIDAEVAALTDAELRRAMPALWQSRASA